MRIVWAQVALNWLLQRQGMTAPIIGARTLEQLESNVGAEDWTLDEEQKARLTEASKVELPYSDKFVERAKDRL